MPSHISGITLHKGQGEGRAAADESRSVVSLVIEGPSGASPHRRRRIDSAYLSVYSFLSSHFNTFAAAVDRCCARQYFSQRLISLPNASAGEQSDNVYKATLDPGHSRDERGHFSS